MTRRADEQGARFLIAAALALMPGQAMAQSTLSTGPDCGGDAYSSGQVIEKRPPRRGPLTAMPETLCADVAPQAPRTPVEIGIYPNVGSPDLAGRDGRRGTRDPYEDEPLRQRRP